MKAVRKHPMAEATQVAIITAVKSIPVICSILGFTKIMYDMAKKVVKPAIISVRTLVLFSFNLKTRSNSASLIFRLLSHLINRSRTVSVLQNIYSSILNFILFNYLDHKT